MYRPYYKVSRKLKYAFAVTSTERTLVYETGGYAGGLLLITPLGDMVRRRSLTLLLIIITTFLTVGLAVGKTWSGFLALNFLVGLFTVAPQVCRIVPFEHRGIPPAHNTFDVDNDTTRCGFGSTDAPSSMYGYRALWAAHGYSSSSCASGYNSGGM
jgi:hypothetical protein